MERHILIRAELVKNTVCRHPGTELFQDRSHFFDDGKWGSGRCEGRWLLLLRFCCLRIALQIGYCRTTFAVEVGQLCVAGLWFWTVPIEAGQRFRIQHAAGRLTLYQLQ